MIDAAATTLHPTVASRGRLRNYLRPNAALIPASILGMLLVCEPVHAQRPRLGNAEQIQVDRAIQDGKKYLLARQMADGSFPGPGHPIGVTALAGLAMLESGTEPGDPSMRFAAQYILNGLSTLDDTYDLSLAILFLDRFGEAKYRRQIQTLAVRLIGGQTATGGWSYKCPLFVKRDHDELLRVLRRQEQLDKQEAMQGIAGGKGAKDKMRPSAGSGRDEKLSGVGTKGKGEPEKGPSASSASSSEAASLAQLPRPGMCIKSADDANLATAPAKRAPADAPADGQSAKKVGGKIAVAGQLGFLPVLQDLDNPGEHNARGGPADAPIADAKARTDNSNTQFAILAMWTAQRHEVPVRRTLQLIVKRFRESYCPDGGWVYGYTKPGNGVSTPAMTCAGLAGLAIGFGLTDAKKPGNKDDEKLVMRAFRCLMKFVGESSDKWEKPARLEENNNLYYLWSIERVAVMYNLPTIGDRDWYRWGAEILVTNQSQRGQQAGAWLNGGNTILADPVVNTSLALLFLRGANLTADLTDRLPINPEELNKELAGLTGSSMRTTPKVPGKGEANNPLGDIESREKERAIDPPPIADNPEPSKQKPAAQPAAQSTSTPSTPTATPKKEEGGNGPMIAIFAVVAVIVIAGVGAAIFFVTRKGKKSDPDDDKPGRARRGSRFASQEDDDEEEEERPKPRRPPPATRAGGKKPSRARYDDDDDDDD
jgi:hypothetical protein